MVQADVIEGATGHKEVVEDKSCQFTSSPYLIQFKNTPKYFKPGLRFVVKVRMFIIQSVEHWEQSGTKPIESERPTRGTGGSEGHNLIRIQAV